MHCNLDSIHVPIAMHDLNKLDAELSAAPDCRALTLNFVTVFIRNVQKSINVRRGHQNLCKGNQRLVPAEFIVRRRDAT